MGLSRSAPLLQFRLPVAAFKLPTTQQYTFPYRNYPRYFNLPSYLEDQIPVVFPSVVRAHTAPLAQGPAFVTRISTLPVIPQRIFSQVRSQDEHGGYHFSYAGGPSSRTETRDHNGVVRGGYSYVDPSGQLQSYQYIADKGGFRVTGGAAPLVYSSVDRSRADLELPRLVIHRTARKFKSANDRHSSVNYNSI